LRGCKYGQARGQNAMHPAPEMNQDIQGISDGGPWFDHSDAFRNLWRVAFLLPAAGLHHGSHGAVSLLAHPEQALGET
jgi:hypothetical protein